MHKHLVRLAVLATIVGGTTLGGRIESAEAAGWWRSEYLGRLGTGDNADYWKAQRRMSLPTPPWDRNALCRWKYGTPSKGYREGRAVSWWGSDNWKTDCYQVQWKWWWER
jgi:hypothetical protein